MSTERNTLVALARWQVIAEATDERLSPSERGMLLSEIASRVHRDADGRPRRYSVRTLYRWVQAWRLEGFEGSKPRQRRDAGTFKTDAETLELAAALRREAPARSAAQISEILARARDVVVGVRTLQRFFAANGLDRARLEGRHRAYGRFEAAACGDLWTADAWDGPALAELSGRHAQLFSLLDDHSRRMPGGGFYPDVSERWFQHCLRKAIGRHGIPRVLYIDNGAAFAAHQLSLICARLGIRITHTPPYRPQGRGKKERVYRTIAEQFAVEVEHAGVTTLEQLNRYFVAWVEQVYHHRVHRSTGQTPVQRWINGPSSLRPAPDPAELAAAFWWEHTRAVSKQRCVSLFGNLYEVDPVLVGRKVKLRYDPEDMSVVHVYYHDELAGVAVPAELRHHVDPKLRHTSKPEPGEATGVSYLDAVLADHAAMLAESVSYYQPPAIPEDSDVNGDVDDGGQEGR